MSEYVVCYKDDFVHQLLVLCVCVCVLGCDVECFLLWVVFRGFGSR